ncbi:MAG: MBL fold metallo-hydrolase [Thermodesulfobacteriota bacterium]|nr:MBL fold metallo-hydrolase [Thermodesulfobacteriota bacterium]
MTEQTKQNKEEEMEEAIKELEQQYTSVGDQPKHPGWVTIAEIFNKAEPSQKTDPIFENMVFMLGYDYSSNIYVLKGDYLTIVDPGNDYTSFMALFNLDYEPGDIKKIVLTHGHRDHAMGIFELLNYPTIMENKDIEIIIHEKGPDMFKQMIEETGFPFTLVKGGETLDLGGSEWEVIPTPGHTMDGISLYNAPTKTAFTGDTILPYGMADVDDSAGGRLDHYLFSVKELLKRDIENILPGHGVPVVSAGRRVMEVAYEGVIAKILEIEGNISWMDVAPHLVQKGLLEEAVYCCDKKLAGDTEDLIALQLKAYCLTDMGRSQESIELLDKILARETNNPHALLGKGHALLGMQQYEESLQYFDDVLKINPDIKETHIYKGMALYSLGKYDEAMDIEVFRTEFAERFKDQLEKKE